MDLESASARPHPQKHDTSEYLFAQTSEKSYIRTRHTTTGVRMISIRRVCLRFRSRHVLGGEGGFSTTDERTSSTFPR